MECYLCKSKDYHQREGQVRDNDEIKVYECNICGLVFLSDFSHIDEKFYQESNMNTDITSEYSKWLQETQEDDKRRFEFIKSSIIGHSLLDFGSGAGGFLTQVKSICNDVTGLELDRRVQSYYLNKNIKFESDIYNLKENSFDTITMFHVLEHLKDPISVLKNLSKSLKNNGSIIIEVPNANDALLSIYNNDAFKSFTYWSCHLFLFTKYSLEKVCQKAGYKVEFIKHIQRYPLSNHIYWLANNKPGGHKYWANFLDSPSLSKEYESSLAAVGATDTIVAKIIKN
ncbi:MAG: class I SAM-dependent methyltransferase [Arcobacteraceae bacterium]|nr:class I SAM-dependent methyltransferase [Arcobacteraceae bacterium]